MPIEMASRYSPMLFIAVTSVRRNNENNLTEPNVASARCHLLPSLFRYLEAYLNDYRDIKAFF